jgi:hypothetical protein
MKHTLTRLLNESEPPISIPVTQPVEALEVIEGQRHSKNCGSVHKLLSTKYIPYAACIQASRKASIRPRKVLGELSINSLHKKGGEIKHKTRAPRTRYGCSNCKIFLCNLGLCWSFHDI